MSIVSLVSEPEENPMNKDTEYEYKGSPYLGYLKIGGSITLPLLFFFFYASAQTLANSADYFLNVW